MEEGPLGRAGKRDCLFLKPLSKAKTHREKEIERNVGPSHKLHKSDPYGLLKLAKRASWE